MHAFWEIFQAPSPLRPALTELVDRERRERVALEFDDPDVTCCYTLRPPCSPEVIDFIATLSREKSRLLDIGCGTGKLSIPLSEHFREVVSLDPSSHMIEEEKRIAGKLHSNVEWVHSTFEEHSSFSGFDVVTAGSSIHRLYHGRVFPRLSGLTNILVIVSGDEPEPPPCGEREWETFIVSWLDIMSSRTGIKVRPYNPSAFRQIISGNCHGLMLSRGEPLNIRSTRKLRILLRHSIRERHGAGRLWALSGLRSLTGNCFLFLNRIPVTALFHSGYQRK